MAGFSAMRQGVIAALVAIIMAAAVMAAGTVVLQAVTRDSLVSLEQAREAGVAGVGRSVADQLSRALGYGIPIDALYGLDRYLATLIEGSPSLEAATVVVPDGTVIHATDQGSADPGSEGVAFPVIVDGETVAEVRLVPAPTLLGPAMERLWMALALTAAAVGLMGGVACLLFLRRHHAVAHDRLRALFAAAVADRFPAFPAPTATGSVARSLMAFDAALDPLRRAARVLSDAVATVRAIDFDDSLADRLAPMIAPARARMALVETDRRSEAAWTEVPTAGIWLLVGLAGLYATLIPFVANFAVDRQSAVLSASTLPAVVLAAEAAAGLLGAWVGRRTPPTVRPAASALGVLVVGIAAMLVYGTRDFGSFVQYRALGAAGLGLAAGATLGRSPDGMRSLVLPVLLGSVLLAGPLIGGLLGEALGRRTAFLTVGVAFIAAAFATLAVRPLQRSGDAPPGDVSVSTGMLMAAAGAAVGSTLAVWIPTGAGYGDYLSGALWIAAAGLGAAVVPLRSPWVGIVLTAGAMVVLDFGVEHPAFEHPGGLFALLIAFGAGLRALFESSARLVSAEAFAGGAAGLAAGAFAFAMSEPAGVPPLSAAGALVVLLAGSALILAGRSEREER